MRTVLRSVFGLLLAFIGAVFFAVSVMALLDPVGTQMADDSNPFGTPPPWYAAALGILISGAVAGAGVWLLRRRVRTGERAV